jgi:hypothetical protein
VDLKLKYEKALAKLTLVGKPILIRDAVDAAGAQGRRQGRALARPTIFSWGPEQ